MLLTAGIMSIKCNGALIRTEKCFYCFVDKETGIVVDYCDLHRPKPAPKPKKKKEKLQLEMPLK